MYRPFVKIDYTSDRWRRLAYQCKKRRGFACAACGKKYRPWQHYLLDAHHPDRRAYQKGLNIRPEELVPLCGKLSGRKCHPRGYYSRWEVSRDRETWRWVNALLWCLAVSWRAIRAIVSLVSRRVRKQRPSPQSHKD